MSEGAKAVQHQLRQLEEAFGEAAPPAPAATGEEAAQRLLELARAVEALLFASGEALSLAELAPRFAAGADIAAALAALQGHYAGRGIELVEAAGKWRFQSAADLKHLFTETKAAPKRLSKAALECLGIIAYHQPVTRAEVEEIRGVSLSRGTLDLLLEIGWVRPRGRRRTPGRPLTYGTSEAFLSHFGLPSLDALPGKDDLKTAGLLDARLPQGFEMPRPNESSSADEDPLEEGAEGPEFYVDHIEPTDE